jgi:DNA repair protein RadC
MSAVNHANTSARSTCGDLRKQAERRLLELGPSALSEIELLVLLLPMSHRGQAYQRLATLIDQFGSLRAWICADRQSALAAGCSERHFTTLQAAIELARRHYQHLMTRGFVLSDPRALRDYLRMRLRDLNYEVFAIVYLDNRHRVIGFEELFRGTIDGASVYPREVVKHALARNAAAVILTHNHPSGVAEPSGDDERITRRLKDALSLVDIRVLDHLIVGDGVCESFAERGLL